MLERYRWLAAAIAFCGLLSPSVLLGAPSDTWAMWQGDAGHTGYQPDTLLFPQRTFAWSESAQPLAITGLAASGTMVFTTDTAAYQTTGSTALAAQAMADGHGVWSISFPSGTAISAPAYSDGKVFVVESIQAGAAPGSRFLDAFDAASGAAVYRVPLAPAGIMLDSPTISGGHVYFESSALSDPFPSNATNTFGSVSAATGALEWQSQSTQGDGTMPTVFGGRIFGYTTQLNVFDGATGTAISSIANPLDAADLSSGRCPTVLGTAAYGIQGGRVVAFDLVAGAVAWTRDGNALGQIATDGQYLFHLSAGALAVRDASTGTLQWGWEAPQSGPVNSGALTDNLIVTRSHVILTDGIKTYFIDRTTHLPVGSYAVAGLIAYAGDKLIIADAQGIVTTIHLPSDELFSNSFE